MPMSPVPTLPPVPIHCLLCLYLAPVPTLPSVPIYSPVCLT